MALKIKVYSDYVCPYCFLGKEPLKQAISGKDVEVEWMPFELRPYPNETLRPELEHVQFAWKNSILPKAKQMGLNMVLPKISPQPHTHLAHEGYQFAKEHGKGAEYNEVVINAFFQDGQNIGHIDVLSDLAEQIGLDRKMFYDALSNRIYEKQHKQALNHAYEAGITAVPTLVIGDKVVQGMRNQKALEEIIEAELTKTDAADSEGLSCGIDGCHY